MLCSTGSRQCSSVVMAHGLSCPVACEILPHQALNPWPCTGRQIPNHWTTYNSATDKSGMQNPSSILYLPEMFKVSRLDMMVRLQLECAVHLRHLSGQFHCQKQTALCASQSFHFYCKDKKHSLMVSRGICKLSGVDDRE